MLFSCYWNPTVLTVGGCQRYICSVYKEGSSKEGDTERTIDLYQCDETGTFYLYYERWAYSFQFPAGSIPLDRFYLEISEKERKKFTKKELIQLVNSVKA